MKKIVLGVIVVFIFVAGLAAFKTQDFIAADPDLGKQLNKERKVMLKKHLKERGISDERVLEAMKVVQRHLFVPESFRSMAYIDGPLSIGYEQTISQPYIVALMTQVLDLKPTDRVLEIGTGSGYQAAVLAEIVERVYSMEIIPELAKNAEALLSSMGYKNISILVGDGYKGWPEEQPFDAIIVTAAPEEIPEALIEQLSDKGGKMVIPVGDVRQQLILVTKTLDQVKKKVILPVRFVPLVPQDPSSE